MDNLPLKQKSSLKKNNMPVTYYNNSMSNLLEYSWTNCQSLQATVSAVWVFIYWAPPWVCSFPHSLLITDCIIQGKTRKPNSFYSLTLSVHEECCWGAEEDCHMKSVGKAFTRIVLQNKVLFVSMNSIFQWMHQWSSNVAY